MTDTTLPYLWPASGVSYSGDRKREVIQPRHVVPRDTSAATNQTADAGFDHHYAKLRVLGKDRSLVPGGAEAPTANAQAFASVLLNELQANRIVPTRVVASAEGGVAICFVNGDKYADVEFLNSGEILGVVSNRRDKPIVWAIDPSSRELAGAAHRISKFLDAPATSEDASKRTWRR